VDQEGEDGGELELGEVGGQDLPARLEGRRHCRQGSLCFCDGGGVVVVVVVWSPLLSSPPDRGRPLLLVFKL